MTNRPHPTFARLPYRACSTSGYDALVEAQGLLRLLFGVPATDASTFAAATIFLIVVAALACVVPAWRATGVEPAVVLRND